MSSCYLHLEEERRRWGLKSGSAQRRNKHSWFKTFFSVGEERSANKLTRDKPASSAGDVKSEKIRQNHAASPTVGWSVTHVWSLLGSFHLVWCIIFFHFENERKHIFVLSFGSVFSRPLFFAPSPEEGPQVLRFFLSWILLLSGRGGRCWGGCFTQRNASVWRLDLRFPLQSECSRPAGRR